MSFTTMKKKKKETHTHMAKQHCVFKDIYATHRKAASVLVDGAREASRGAGEGRV